MPFGRTFSRVMGNTGSGLSRTGSQGGLDDDDDLNDSDAFHASVLTVPDETVKIRGRLGLRTGNSHNKKTLKSGSMQSALSVDMENPEVERIRREFEMYRKNKENEITNIQKSEKRNMAENKRLRTELQALQRTCTRLRGEREEAMQAEHQAMARATTFETERDKVQRQFKIFRETKEKEIQNLLRAKRDLEGKLSKVAPHMLPDDTLSKSGADDNNPGDWWTQLNTDISNGSNPRLDQPIIRGHEFTSSLLQLEMAQGLNRDIWQFSSDCANNAALHLYITYTKDMEEELNAFLADVIPELRMAVENDGHYLNVINFSLENEMENITDEKIQALRKQFSEQCTILVGFLGNTPNTFAQSDVHHGHLKNPGGKPTLFVMKSDVESDSELTNIKTEVRRTGEAKIFEKYFSIEELMGALLKELKTNVLAVISKLRKMMEAGLDVEKTESSDEPASADTGFTDVDNDACGCNIWDEHSHSEHLEAVYYAAKCAHECCLEKLFDRLNNHITAPGPSPPLLVTGSPGSGKSLLLARWIQQHQVRGSPGIILYHFVGCKNSVSADPLHMIRRLTSQLMQHAVSPPALTCEPSRLMEEFPRWLEKVSTKTPGGVTVVIDGLDRFQQGETNLRWLLDPLPVDSRVIVSVNEETCAPAWKQWHSLRIEPFTSKSVKELLRNELQQKHCYLDSESEAKILTHCRTPNTCSPLYITVLASCLASVRDEKKLQHQLDQCLAADDAVELYLVVLDYLREELETSDLTKGCMKKVLKLIYSSRNGLGDWECLAVLPSISWNFWAVLTHHLLNFSVIAYRAGLICLAHDQIREAVELKYFPRSDDGKQLSICRNQLVDYFTKSAKPGMVTCRVADELPWLLQQLGIKEGVKDAMLSLCIFLRLYVRGRCNELISYWQYIGIDKNQMAELYLATTRKYEAMVDKMELVTLPKISDMYEAQGKFLRDLGMLKEACNPLQRSLELRETTLDPDHPRVAQSLHLLAGVHAQWNKYPAAESLYKQALDIYQNAYGADHLMVAKELDALVVLYQKQNKHEIAEPLKKQANVIRKKNRVPQISTDDNENIRSSSFKNKRNGMQLHDLTMGPDSPELATKLNELGVLYYVQGNHSTAESFFKRCLKMREKVLPPDHTDIGQSCKNLAALYYDQKELEKAEPLYDRALQIKLKHYSPDSPQVVSVVKNLAPVCKKLQKWQKAAPLYKQIVELREKTAGDKPDPSLATALVNLAVIYCHVETQEIKAKLRLSPRTTISSPSDNPESQQSDAHPLYERALKIYEKSLGLFHPRVAETLHNIAVLKYEQGDYEAAAKLYKRATDIKNSPSYRKDNKIPASRTSSVSSIPIMSSATPVKTQKIFIEALESHS